MDWMEIETAPKDRPILVWYDHDADPYCDPANPALLTAYACHAESGDFLDGTGITIARWCEAYEESNGWEAGDSWWMPAVWCAWFDNDNADQVCNPTHWMPLPPPPQGIDARSGETAQQARSEGRKPGPKDAPNA